MAIPIISQLGPNTTAKNTSLPINVAGSGFFGGGVSFDVQSVKIGGTTAVIMPGGTDVSFNIMSPVVTNSGSFDIIVTTSAGSSSGGPKFIYTEFLEGQDRSIDYKTAQFWCYGCPFLEIKNNPRPMGNAVGFDSVEPRYANTTKTHYWCGSPNVNFKQRYSQNTSLLGVGFCPFLQQKLDLLYNVADSF